MIEIGYERGVPNALDGRSMAPVDVIESLNEIGFEHAIGRAIHVGDAILGIKGRVAFQAPAAVILISTHRELEKIVLSRWQLVQKNQLADFYGMLMHEAQYFDPVMRDIEGYFNASQSSVTGAVRIRLFKGSTTVLGATSPHSLFDSDVARYGEENRLWDGRDAQGFSRILGVQSTIAARVRRETASDTGREAAGRGLDGHSGEGAQDDEPAGREVSA